MTLPRRITYPDADRVPWLNKAVRQMWPFLNKAISNSVVSSVEPLLNKLTAAAKLKLVFSKFTLGLEPPVLVSVKAVDEVPNEIGLDIEFKWAAADPEVQLDVGVMGVVLPIALERVQAFGCVRVVFGPLCDWWPTFSDMQVAGDEGGPGASASGGIHSCTAQTTPARTPAAFTREVSFRISLATCSAFGSQPLVHSLRFTASNLTREYQKNVTCDEWCYIWMWTLASGVHRQATDKL